MQKKKSRVKNVWKFVPLRGGVGRLMAKTILNFHFDYLKPSLRFAGFFIRNLVLKEILLIGLLPTTNIHFEPNFEIIKMKISIFV